MEREKEQLLREKHGGKKTPAFTEDCARLDAGEPLAYVIGFSPFFGTKICLDSRPLIPRTETEFWLEEPIREMKRRCPEPLRILDLCAGSGAIGIAVLKNTRNTLVDLAEIEERHHPTIERNIVENGVERTRARIMGGDLFEHIDGRYDYILSNPPYIDPLLNRTAENVRTFEPHEALFGGARGLEYLARIIREAGAHLTQNGVLYLEHEPEQVNAIGELANEYGFRVETKQDQFGVFRYSRLSATAPRRKG